MENRNGLLVEIQIAPATGTAERDTAIKMIDEQSSRRGAEHARWGIVTRQVQLTIW